MLMMGVVMIFVLKFNCSPKTSKKHQLANGNYVKDIKGTKPVAEEGTEEFHGITSNDEQSQWYTRKINEHKIRNKKMVAIKNLISCKGIDNIVESSLESIPRAYEV